MNVPLHLPDSLEYKFLGCIPDHHRLWMVSSEIRMAVQISPLQCRQDRTRRGVGWLRTNVYAACSGGVVVVVLGDLVTLEAFCKGLERSTQLFIMDLGLRMNLTIARN